MSLRFTRKNKDFSQFYRSHSPGCRIYICGSPCCVKRRPQNVQDTAFMFIQPPWLMSCFRYIYLTYIFILTRKSLLLSQICFICRQRWALYPTGWRIQVVVWNVFVVSVCICILLLNHLRQDGQASHAFVAWCRAIGQVVFVPTWSSLVIIRANLGFEPTSKTRNFSQPHEVPWSVWLPVLHWYIYGSSLAQCFFC